MSAVLTEGSAGSPIITGHVGSYYEVEGNIFHIVYRYDPSDASLTLYKAELSNTFSQDGQEYILERKA